MYGTGDNATRFISQFQRTDFHLNGDIDEFWCGGDEHKWMYMRQKSTGMLWVNDGNYGTYGGRVHVHKTDTGTTLVVFTE